MVPSALHVAVRPLLVSLVLAGLLATPGIASADQTRLADPSALPAEDAERGPDMVTDDQLTAAAPVESAGLADAGGIAPGAAAPGATSGPPTSRYTFSTPPDRPARYVGQVSCEPGAKPGTLALRQLLIDTYGSASIGTQRDCSSGGRSEHKDGRALDWMLDVGDAADKSTADDFLAWLTGPDAQGVAAGNAHRLGVMYVIWNRQTWQSWTGAWKPYTGVNPHTDHIHVSLAWNGAMQQTSWWTGIRAEQDDYGPCQVYVGQLAPRYSGPRYIPCPPPVHRSGVAFPRLWDGDAAADVIATTSKGALMLYSGSGASAFRRTTQIGHGWTSMNRVTATGDFDQDGKRDLVARDTAGRLYLYRGNGSGGFVGVTQVGHGWSGMDTILGAGDLDGDGAVDLVARRASDGVVVVYKGTGSGQISGVHEAGRWNDVDLVVAAGDWDGDALPDLLTRDAASGRLDLRAGDGRGGFEHPVAVGRGWGGMDAVIGTGDFSGDGNPDLLARQTNGRLYLYRGNGTGGFGTVSQVGHGWGALALAN